MDRRHIGLLWARLIAAVALVGAILAVTVVAFFQDGLGAATGWFQLSQGVAGLALGWLFTSHGMDQALAQAAEAASEAERVRNEGATLEDLMAKREVEMAALQRILAAVASDPAVAKKIEEVVREIGEVE